MRVPLSVLDLAPISAGSDAVTALHNAVDLAQHVERWGYRRFWVGEHHFGAVASSQPAVLIGQIATATQRIRVGAAAVQLGQTSPSSVVESFGILEAFHSGRIDLGVGRSRRELSQTVRGTAGESAPQILWRGGVTPSPPFDTQMMSHNDELSELTTDSPQAKTSAIAFAEQLSEIVALLDGSRTIDGLAAGVNPGRELGLTPWVFGSSKGQSAVAAGLHGLPFVASYHLTPATALDAIDVYRHHFAPSAALAEPYVVVSADVVVADDTATARHLASSYGHWVHSIRSGHGAIPYPDPDQVEPLTGEQAMLVQDRIATQFVGDADEVAHRLDALQQVTSADELVITSMTHGHSDRRRSHELLAGRWMQ